MRLPELALLYALIGTGVAGWAFTQARAGRRRPAEVLLAFAFWPLYGPFLLQPHVAAVAPEDAGFLEALGRIEGTPLAALLPSGQAAKVLALRIRLAMERITEIDRLLAQPDFSESAAEARHAEFVARGDTRAAAAAQSRANNIRRLRGLRDRFARELDEVRELLGQLRVQAEVVRLAGAPGAQTRDLVTEILSRVEGLDAILADDAEAEGGAR